MQNLRAGTGERQKLYVYTNASKWYAFCNLDADGDIELRGALGSIGDDGSVEAAVRKYSQHGPGAYEVPRDPEIDKTVKE